MEGKSARRTSRRPSGTPAPSRRSKPGPKATAEPANESDTRERLLTEAEAFFARHGFAGTSIRDITDAVGIKPPAIYNHFAGKEELYAAVLERSIGPIRELVGRLPRDQLSSAGAHEVMRGGAAVIQDHPRMPALVFLESITRSDHLPDVVAKAVRPLLELSMDRIGEYSIPEEWSEQDHRFIIWSAFLNVLGYFALAPLYEELFGEDPLAEENLNAFVDFVARMNDVAFRPR